MSVFCSFLNPSRPPYLCGQGEEVLKSYGECISATRQCKSPPSLPGAEDGPEEEEDNNSHNNNKSKRTRKRKRKEKKPIQIYLDSLLQLIAVFETISDQSLLCVYLQVKKKKKKKKRRRNNIFTVCFS